MPLELYHSYDRREVHDIFEPATNFVPGAAVWGSSGIVPIRSNPGDYVFYVTNGTTQGDHTFVEDVFDDGTFTWQSQPRNKMTSKYVVDFIRHNPAINTVYLFYRMKKTDKKYVYLGPLEYVAHDNTQECPVHFMWKIIQFNLDQIHHALPGLEIKEKSTGNAIQLTRPIPAVLSTGTLTQHNAPNRVPINRNGVNSAAFTGRNVDFQGEQAKNSRLGNAGEDAVVRIEKERLIAAGHPELADLVVATRTTIGNTAKFDVQSYEVDGTARYIEVKTTTGAAQNRIHISEGEVSFSETHSEHYYLYRLYNFMRMLDYILDEFDSYAVITTHSPLIIQEIPSSHVQIIQRVDDNPRVRNPVVECFGESISLITRDVFHVDQDESCYQLAFEKMKKAGVDKEAVNAMFNGRLGLSARISLERIYSDD